MIGPAGFMAAPKLVSEPEPVYCKCCRCRHTHMRRDRIRQPSRRFGAGWSELACPSCGSRLHFEIDRAEHEAAEAKRARKAAKRVAQSKRGAE